MLGFHPLGTKPLSTVDEGAVLETQTVTLRYASQSFVTRSDDVPPLTFMPGRIKNIETLGRQLVSGNGGQFGSIAEAVFGEIILDNSDGALDPLANDYFADGRAIRLKIGATEIVATTTISPGYIATGAGSSSGTADALNVLTAEHGTYDLTGQGASLFTNVLTAAQGAYALSGQNANLFAGFALVEAEQGSYVLTGQDAHLFAGFGLIADQGSYALSGQDANLSTNAFGMIDFGADNGATPNRHYTIAHAPELDLIASTGWAWGMFVNHGSNAGTGQERFFTSGTINVSPNVNLQVTEASFANPNRYTGSINANDLNSGANNTALTNQLRLLVLQRGTTNTVTWYGCIPGGSPVTIQTASITSNIVLPENWQIGRSSASGGSNHFKRQLGGLWKADRALTVSEIGLIANGASPEVVLGSALAGWWPFRDGAVATEPDLSGNGNDATRVGTGWT